MTLGADSELRLCSAQWESLAGSVKRISPKAEEREFGRVVRVLIEVPNPDGRLKPNMTGFGKIIADERPAREAFTRSSVRFFEIEVWSWIPYGAAAGPGERLRARRSERDERDRHRPAGGRLVPDQEARPSGAE